MVTDVLQHNILYSCTSHSKRGSEQLVQEHSLGYILSGEVHFYTNNGLQILKEGTIGLIKKNQLVKAFKVPGADGVFKSINILLDQVALRQYSSAHDIHIDVRYSGEPMVLLSPDPFIKGYFNSLQPYFDRPGQLSKAMADLKTSEAIELLLRIPGLKDFLFDFTEPFKIDLEAFMNANFKYHVSISQFAKLTGRSLATFKRDFKKTFNLPPERWLHKKRLEMAHYLIGQKKQNPTEVYLEVGFENMSHFSYSFKKHYGYNPSSI